ncbi:MAG TPA: hypothetical protein VLR90_07960, partial [Blastocatellia bacterium]|nr:hypothetical protein [Blastocatellia bacterium]
SPWSIQGIVSGGWGLSLGNKFYVGDFDGLGRDELIAFDVDAPAIGLIKWDGKQLYSPWIVTGQISGSSPFGNPGWTLAYNDQFYVANLYGKSDKLFAFNPTSLWAGVIEWNGSELQAVWVMRGMIDDSWKLDSVDQFFPANFDGTGDKLVAFKSDSLWIGVIEWDDSQLQTVWTSQGEIDDSWKLDAPDQFFPANVYGTGDKLVAFKLDSLWVGVIAWSGSELQTEWVKPNHIPGWSTEVIVSGPANPFTPFPGTEADAYTYISNQLNPYFKGDIRPEYQNTNYTNSFGFYQQQLENMEYPQGASFTEADFNTVKATLCPELGFVSPVASLFNNMGALAFDIQNVQNVQLPAAWDNVFEQKPSPTDNVTYWVGQIGEACLWGLAAITFEIIPFYNVAMAMAASFFGSILSFTSNNQNEQVQYTQFSGLPSSIYLESQTQNGNSENTVLGDSVMLLVVGELASEGWQWDANDSVTIANASEDANRGMFYQILIKERYNILRWLDTQYNYPSYTQKLSYNYYTYGLELNAPSDAWWLEPSDEGTWNVYLLCSGTKYDEIGYPSSDLLNDLWKLVSKENFFKGLNGWNNISVIKADLVEIL